MKAKRTPGPYRYRDSFSEGEPIGFVLLSRDNEAIADILYLCPEGSEGQRDEAEAEANAAFIVRACNVHDELVEALEASVDHGHPKSGLEPGRGVVCKVCDASRAALAKAEES